MRNLHLEDGEGTGAWQIVLESHFPEMGIGNVKEAPTDRETVRPGQF
jgi:hypothetical protein